MRSSSACGRSGLGACSARNARTSSRSRRSSGVSESLIVASEPITELRSLQVDEQPRRPCVVARSNRSSRRWGSASRRRSTRRRRRQRKATVAAISSGVPRRPAGGARDLGSAAGAERAAQPARVDEAGGDRVDADALHDQLLGDRAGEAEDPGLGRRVVRVPGAALDPADRGHVDDRRRARARPSPGPPRGCRRRSRRGGRRGCAAIPRRSAGPGASSGVCATPSARSPRAGARAAASHADVVDAGGAGVVDEDLEWAELASRSPATAASTWSLSHTSTAEGETRRRCVRGPRGARLSRCRARRPAHRRRRNAGRSPRRSPRHLRSRRPLSSKRCTN